MKTVVSQVVVALSLVALGSALWIASAWERRAARADEALVTLRYQEPAIQYAGLEDTMRPARGVPWLDGLIAAVRERRAVAQYWQSTDVAPDRDPAVVFVVANATYRAAQREHDKGLMLPVGIDFGSLQFGAARQLGLLVAPGGLLVLWVWQLARRRRDRGRYARSRTIPVRERISLAGGLLFWLCLIIATALVVVALSQPRAAISVVRTAGIDLIVLQD